MKHFHCWLRDMIYGPHVVSFHSNEIETQIKEASHRMSNAATEMQAGVAKFTKETDAFAEIANALAGKRSR